MSGYYKTVTRIKDDAKPIDNETKWAWDDDDYEESQEWHEYTDAELDQLAKPTLDDVSDALADAAETVSGNADEVQVLSDAIAELSEIVASMMPTETEEDNG